MGTAWLYTQEGCGGCDRARALLAGHGYTVIEVAVDNPLLELGVRQIFRDHLVHTPVVVLPGRGVYVLSSADAGAALMRIISTEADRAAVEAVG